MPAHLPEAEAEPDQGLRPEARAKARAKARVRGQLTADCLGLGDLALAPQFGRQFEPRRVLARPHPLGGGLTQGGQGGGQVAALHITYRARTLLTIALTDSASATLHTTGKPSPPAAVTFSATS
jgi:hypothetical protein